MSRFEKVGNRGREQRKARSSGQIVEGIAIAQRMYLETGGEDIDFGIRSARLMLQLYQEQLESGPRPGVEPISHQLAVRTRQQLASLMRLRERKLADLQQRVDESQQAEADRADAERDADVPSAETPVTDQDQKATDTEPASDADRRSALQSAARQAG
jgi:hypothetical protein